MKVKLFQLQSGFVTLNSSGLKRSANVDGGFRDSFYETDYHTFDTESQYDSGIESLFQQWRGDNSKMREFGFRNEIAKNFIRVFKTSNADSFYPWIKLQLESNRLGPLHFKFLSEFFGDQFTNNRSIEPYTYFRLLNRHTRPMAHGEVVDIGRIVPQGQSLKISDVLCNMTRDIDAYSELLNILHVIFGERSGFVAKIPDKG